MPPFCLDKREFRDGRPLCAVEGCGNLAERSGNLRGGYRGLCSTHRRKRAWRFTGKNQRERYRLREMEKRCTRCGLEHENPRFFDLHHPRGYLEPDTYVVLCPNCHREVSIEENHYIRRRGRGEPSRVPN